jgi:glutathione reductase (NADPH)
LLQKYDAVVIGTGVAGSVVATKCREAGMKVAVVDSRPYGGTCPLRGCNPKKVLVGAAELVDWNNRMEGKGIFSKRTAINWPSLRKFKRTFTGPVPQKMEERFRKQGVAMYQGRACFSDESTLTIGDERVTARYIVIATGARPKRLYIPGEEYFTTSEEFMELPQLPRDIVFVGGGYISFEFAHVAARAGSRVTILHLDDTPLRHFDRDLAGMLITASKAAGIEVQTNAAVTALEKNKYHVLIRTTSEMFESLLTEIVVHGAGRVPDIEDLNLNLGRVETKGGGVAVNKYLQSTSNPAVYAAGDCTGIGPPLTPVAELEGEIAATNMIEGNTREVNYTGIPSVVFTQPPLAMVGIPEDEAKEERKVTFLDRSGWYSARRTNQKYAASKVIIDGRSDKILGAHLLGENAGEVINIFALAMRLGLTASQLKEAVYTYPSICSDIVHMF